MNWGELTPTLCCLPRCGLPFGATCCYNTSLPTYHFVFPLKLCRILRSGYELLILIG